ncbi:TadE/TadG family type IV pilus assembly protein [Aurantiacibacter spongiae]|uniref:Pilus assembly protein n=1 Tax=Aurantiacibacter spongiae TaxID=2488860 RepID=A0A3N5D749_9SPHN|nr:TadE family protein [Aurantiacibacter spongiae]RPF70338.1 pilus assembly protein [Aurantiacibacter spongiae]
MKGGIRKLAADETGVTVVEFALIAPVLALTLMGLFDFSYNIYAETMIEGAVQKAARDSTIETYANSPADLDGHVEHAVQQIVPRSDVVFSRSAYTDYADIGRAEEFTDSNDDGICNDGEPFVDANGNNAWDTDRGTSTTGGAKDAVLYEVTATYDRMFPLAGLLGFDNEVSVYARTVLRNQPYDEQAARRSVGNCP